MEFVPAEMKTFLYWIRERERIRVRKSTGAHPWPWTEDTLLREWKWCNVRRMDDRVSQDLMRLWYDPNAGHRVTLTAAMLARLINWVPSLMEITGDGRFSSMRYLDAAAANLEARVKRGAKVFTGAYIVPGVPGESKVDSVIDLVRSTCAGTIEYPRGGTMKELWTHLRACNGLGSFLAGQIVADIAHLPAGQSWPDRDTWAPVGPGSARGINRLLGKEKDAGVNQEQFEWALAELITGVRPQIAEVWESRELQAMDIQNCLCEFDKYRRLQLGEGTVRARYSRPAAPGFFS